jgi:hypothetical protein
VSADYNAIVHRIGNSGRTMLQESPGGGGSATRCSRASELWESTTNANRVFTSFVALLFTPSILQSSPVDVQGSGSALTS